MGESDNAKWWASDGVLSSLGQYPYERLAPRTAPLARARVVFSIARARCEAQAPKGAVTLWTLPAALEEAFEDRWSYWLDHLGDWAEAFADVEGISTSDVLAALRELNLIGDTQVAEAQALTASPPDPVVELPSPPTIGDDALRRLAAGFACGRTSALVVPYVRAEA